jgi:hypothetical protein
MRSRTDPLVKEGVRVYTNLKEDLYGRIVLKVKDHNEEVLAFVIVAIALISNEVETFIVFHDPVQNRSQMIFLPPQEELKRSWYNRRWDWYVLPPGVEQVFACLVRGPLPLQVAAFLEKIQKLLPSADEIVVRRGYEIKRKESSRRSGNTRGFSYRWR